MKYKVDYSGVVRGTAIVEATDETDAEYQGEQVAITDFADIEDILIDEVTEVKDGKD